MISCSVCINYICIILIYEQIYTTYIYIHIHTILFVATVCTTDSFGRFACFLTLQLQECRNNPSESPGQRCEKPCCRFDITVLGVSWANATQWHCKSCGRRSMFFYISEVFTTILYHLTCCCNILQLHVTAM